jgi:hypothetical protein
MINKFVQFFALIILIQSCSGSDQVEIGNKTTMEVNLVFDAGKVVKGEVIDAKFTIKNTGDFPLVIGDVKGSCSCTVAEKPEEPILPGEEGIVKAHVTTQSANAGVLAKMVNIVANTEPSRTEVVIRATILDK